eukprot:scaffold7340_cov266-Pinguiococcus_pyrenoidosus.AAC.71
MHSIHAKPRRETHSKVDLLYRVFRLFCPFVPCFSPDFRLFGRLDSGFDTGFDLDLGVDPASAPRHLLSFSSPK